MKKSAVPASGSSKHCPSCQSSHLVELFSQYQKICTRCGTTIPWELTNGQKPLTQHQR